MPHEPRPAFRSDFLKGLFDGDRKSRDARTTMEITETDLEPDTRASMSGTRDTRVTIEVEPDRDLLPDEARVTPVGADGAHHPHTSPPMTVDVEHGGHRHHHWGGPWILAAGAVLLLAPIVMSARTPPQLGGDPVVGAAAAAPPLAAPPVSSPEVDRQPRWEMDLADRFVLAREDEATRARRELALDPVRVTNDPATGAEKAPRAGHTPKAAFSADQALAAIRAAGIGSAQCGEGAAGATVVSVTFAPSGRVTRALVEDGPLQGTAVGGCIARQLRSVRVAPFQGDFQTLRTDITLR